jgi:hypothetical protein
MSIIDEIWVIRLQKVDTLLMIGIYDKYFHFIPVIMVLYIYKYWFKMLKRWKFPPLIKGRASSANCTMGNLTCSRHATYLHKIYVKSRKIHILSTIQILGNMKRECFKCKNVNKSIFSWTFFTFSCSFLDVGLPNLFVHHMIYWIADKYASPQATFVMFCT